MEVVVRRLTGLLLESVGLPEVREELAVTPIHDCLLPHPSSAIEGPYLGRFGGLPDVARE